MRFGIIEAKKIGAHMYFLREHSTEWDIRNMRSRRRGLTEEANIKIPDLKVETDKGDLFLEGPFAIYDEINLNDRRYKKDIMQQAVDRYNDVYVKGKRAVSELGHPENSDVNVHLVSHGITEPLELRENGIVWGRSKVLKTLPMGKILYDYLKEGYAIGISSRGLGDVEEVELEEDKKDKRTIFDVSDFELSAFDAVWEPSIGKFVEVMERIETEGILKDTNIKTLNMESLMKISQTLLGE